MMTSRIERMLNDIRITGYGKLALLTAAAAAAAVVVALASMTIGDFTASPPQTPVSTNGDFSYFPGQFVNKGTDVPDHVQAY